MVLVLKSALDFSLVQAAAGAQVAAAAWATIAARVAKPARGFVPAKDAAAVEESVVVMVVLARELVEALLFAPIVLVVLAKAWVAVAMAPVPAQVLVSSL